MAKPKLKPREILQRLQMIEALAADGVPVAEAIRSAGMPKADYDRWRLEYNGLGRTLGPLLCATLKLIKTTRRPAPASDAACREFRRPRRRLRCASMNKN